MPDFSLRKRSELRSFCCVIFNFFFPSGIICNARLLASVCQKKFDDKFALRFASYLCQVVELLKKSDRVLKKNLVRNFDAL